MPTYTFKYFIKNKLPIYLFAWLIGFMKTVIEGEMRRVSLKSSRIFQESLQYNFESLGAGVTNTNTKFVSVVSLY